MSQSHEQPTTNHEQHEAEVSEEVIEQLGAAASKDVVDTDGLEDLLDEIDDVLEENAQEFMAAFKQKGGQ